MTCRISDFPDSPILDQPVFCFTSDLDWAPEWAISELFSYFDNMGVPLTPFLTHGSHVIDERYHKDEMRPRVGLHPNFLPQSTHGDTPSQVIDFVARLWPDAISFRSHSFFDNTHITDDFRKRGFRYDSNLCLFLQPNCVPLRHNSGMLRFPVFWEDDIHFSKNLPFDLQVIDKYLDGPGLKVFNVHPFHFALNTPSGDRYAASKHLYNSPDDRMWRTFVFPGKGTRTFVEDLVIRVRSCSYRTVYLYDLFRDISRGLTKTEQIGELEKKTESLEVAEIAQADALTSYQSASREERARFVRNMYDARDGERTYATSRDFNLRELEISFISKHLVPGCVLDIGCGNGYTLLMLAKKAEANFVGLDFSPNMIESAKKLTERLSAELRCAPQFRVCDVRRLPFEDNSVDCVISERCLLNLPSRDDQYQTIREVYRVLKDGGVFIMIEGTEEGLSRLNQVRGRVGLNPIPSVSPDNPSSLKFRETEIEGFLQQMFEIQVSQFFGTYYLISRVVHPLLVHPEAPTFDAKINTVARKIAEVIPDVGKLGHIMGYKLVARKSNEASSCA